MTHSQVYKHILDLFIPVPDGNRRPKTKNSAHTPTYI